MEMARALRGQMTTLKQKAEQLRGTFSGEGSTNWEDIQRSYDNDEVRIRGWQYRDGPRGLNIDQPVFVGKERNSPGTKVAEHGSATAFPAPVARGAAFDVGLEYRIGQAMGDELVAANTSMLLVPCVNILRHPFWGRAQETYGEDSFLLGRIGTGLTAGIQEYSAACAKHWAANNIERDRWIVNSQLEPRTLREIYGRHFEMIVQDGGVACVMASYNAVNGTKATQNAELLTTILRGEFGFKGLVLSDWWAMPGYSTSNLDTTTRTNSAREALLGRPRHRGALVAELQGHRRGAGPGVDSREPHQRARRPGAGAEAPVQGPRHGPARGSEGADQHLRRREQRRFEHHQQRRPHRDRRGGGAQVDGADQELSDDGQGLHGPATDDSNVLPIKPTAGAVTKIAVVGPTMSYCNGRERPRDPALQPGPHEQGQDQLRDRYPDRRHRIESGQRRPRAVGEPVRRHLRGGGRTVDRRSARPRAPAAASSRSPRPPRAAATSRPPSPRRRRPTWSWSSSV